MAAVKPDAIVFLAHVFDPEIEHRFLKLKRECSGLCDVVALVEQGARVPTSVIPFTEFFDFSAVKRMAKSIIGTKVVPGNCHLRSIDFYRHFPKYRFYWFVEYDVTYTGDWAHLVSSLADDQSDLLAAHVRRLADDEDWRWKDSLVTGSDDVRQDDWLLAFLPIHRISSRGLQTVEAKVSEGWTGHFEALLPTAIAHSGLSISDLGGSGAWTPKERVHRHYVDWRKGLHHSYGGSLQFRPSIRIRLIKNMLYHPCKTRLHPGKWHRRRRTILAQLRAPHVFVPYWLRVVQLAIRSRLLS
jgi:hypothetical protein